MKNLSLISILLFISIASAAQKLDLIVTATGSSVACKIDSLSETDIYVKIITNESKTWAATSYSLKNIKSFEYNSIDPELYRFKNGSSVIIGKKSGTSYKYLKGEYLHKSYTYMEGDKFNPAAIGAMSLIPGLGLCYVGEPLRALGFVSGMAGSFVVAVAGFAIAWGEGAIGAPILILGAAGIPFFYVSSIINAVKIAKIKNMANRSLPFSLNLNPNIEFRNQYVPSNNYGLTLSISF